MLIEKDVYWKIEPLMGIEWKKIVWGAEEHFSAKNGLICPEFILLGNCNLKKFSLNVGLQFLILPPFKVSSLLFESDEMQITCK